VSKGVENAILLRLHGGEGKDYSFLVFEKFEREEINGKWILFCLYCSTIPHVLYPTTENS